MKMTRINRRRFIRDSASLFALMNMPLAFSSSKPDKWGDVLPKRILGKTGLEVTIFAVGGSPAAPDLSVYPQVLETAFNGGCRFFDTARAYLGGKSEEVYGNTLAPHRNEIVFLTKTGARDAESVRKDLELSLKSLKTDYIDVYLMHAIRSESDVENRLSGGVYDQMLKAKQEGLIRHIGFSGHSDPFAHNYMIGKNLPELEVVLLPVNVADPLNNSFILNTIPKAIDNNMGIIGMKTFADGGLLGHPITWGQGRGQERDRIIPELFSLEEAQHFSLSLPVASTTIGFHEVSEVEQILTNARRFNGMDESERKRLTGKIRELAVDFTIEHYKA